MQKEKKVKLLILTQKVDMNDDVLGFFHGWLIEFAKHCEKITVICLQKGEYNLPENVEVFSLGKEKKRNLLQKLSTFYFLLFTFRKEYDAVFVHMNPIYVILVGLFWKVAGKKIALWYTHKAVNWKLKIAEKLVDKIFTASKESFRLPSKKVEITGHGIDSEKFSIFNSQFSNKKKDNINKEFTIITAGRISEVKNLHLLIDVAEILKNKNFNFKIKIAGAPILENDKIYFEKLKERIKEKKLYDTIEFVGSVPNKNIAEFYQSGDLFINLSDTGSLDKAILEAMASGLKILTSNEAFKNIVPEDNFTNNDPSMIAEKIESLVKHNGDIGSNLAEYVAKNHGLGSLISNIANFFFY
ncbi:MAG: glycosyltransferase family 4 protein [bacterium]|nr:glycosyltransferase family 4 protein [bacterium]